MGMISPLTSGRTPACSLRIAFACAAVLTAIFFLTGCGQESGNSGSQNEETVAVELAASVVAEDVITADELPTGAGTRLQYVANVPGVPAEVSFSLNGPWNFNSGPAASMFTIAIADKATAAAQDQFPDATIAALSAFTPDTGLAEYNFQSKDESAWLSYGRYRSDGSLRTYSTSVRALIFPAAVGSSWKETYSQTEAGITTDIIAENVIVSKNRLTVPAGTYEALLLQTRVTASSAGQSVATWDYIWFVPGIGRAAEIISLPGEQNEVFDKASALYRLDSFQTP